MPNVVVNRMERLFGHIVLGIKIEERGMGVCGVVNFLGTHHRAHTKDVLITNWISALHTAAGDVSTVVIDEDLGAIVSRFCDR